MALNLRNYVDQAARTSRWPKEVYHGGPADAPGAARVNTACLGLLGEIGELSDLTKKAVGHGHPLDRDKVLKELGDILWYCAETLSAAGIQASAPTDATFETIHLQCRTVAQALGDPIPEPLFEPGTFNQTAASASRLLLEMTREATHVFGHFDECLRQIEQRPFRQCSGCINNLLFFWFRACHLFDLAPEAVAHANLAKLKERYPDGFSTDRSLNREAA